MTRSRMLLIGAALVLGAGLVWAAWPRPASAADRVDRISAELRCPVCQGLSIEDSPSETARSMRALVTQRVAEGRTDDEIRAEFVRSYGDWILLSPPLLSPSGLVWLSPLAAIAVGVWLAWRRARAPTPAAAEISPAERAELESLVAADEP
jgi:cytochrome c-type biogenesis protein CcmH